MKRFLVPILAAVMALAVAATPAAASVSPAPQDAPAKACLWYTVKRGDTLLSLAARYNTTVKAIQTANGMKTTRIYTGTRICIPQPNPPPGPPASGPWYSEYWNNPDQSGGQALVRTQAQVTQNWGYGSPDLMRVQPDNFSARFIRQVYFMNGVYRFSVRADDGVRVWVDGRVVLDQYGYVGDHTWTVDVPVNAGWKTVRVDYVERGGIALVELNYWRQSAGWPLPPPPPPQPGPGAWGGPWSAAFYNNRDLSGGIAWAASVPRVDFNWGAGSPSASVSADNFSARFSCNCNFAAGSYRFVAKADDGVRVYVDGARVIDQWREQSANIFTSADIPLTGGYHNVTVEYMEVGNNALIQAYWINLFTGNKAGN
ncbi:MAG TPA: PA14 domain-containing protein [Thermoflexales bacterium]|nr:PA14 domain-containing protein [Thermoflexales bacterium]HQW35489.1 PA14 domain-containing protein [Thermoflexales bacterium]